MTDTDPAETVRMEKELIKAKYWPSCNIDEEHKREIWCWHHFDRLQSTHADTYERATAEAYLAMEPSE